VTTLIGWLEGWNAVAMVVIGWAMRLAPWAPGASCFPSRPVFGFDILVTLFWFVLTVLTGLVLHLVVTYSSSSAFAVGCRPRQFFRGAREAMLVAFGTSSSNATLPTAIKVAETDLQLPKMCRDSS